MPAVRCVGSVDVLFETDPDTAAVDDLVVGVGAMMPVALEVAGKLAAQGRAVRGPGVGFAVSQDIADLAQIAGRVVVIEDDAAGGIGSAIAQRLREAGVDTPVRGFGIPKALAHASPPGARPWA